MQPRSGCGTSGARVPRAHHRECSRSEMAPALVTLQVIPFMIAYGGRTAEARPFEAQHDASSPERGPQSPLCVTSRRRAPSRSHGRPGRVAPGRHRPGAPTDPDVRDWRIRLLSSWLRCRTEGRVDGDRRREWIALLQLFKPWPRHRALRPTPIQPLLPSATHFPAEPRDRHRVPGDPIVAVVAVEFAAERRVLPDERGVSMVPTRTGHCGAPG